MTIGATMPNSETVEWAAILGAPVVPEEWVMTTHSSSSRGFGHVWLRRVLHRHYPVLVAVRRARARCE